MPGSVPSIDPAGLDSFPVSLYSAYAVRYARFCLTSDYPDGSLQRSSPVTTSTKSWRISKRLTASQLATLRTFYWAHVGKTFLFRDLASGQNIKAVFAGAWSESLDMGRLNVSLDVQEVY
jgi:hypothetical protein